MSGRAAFEGGSWRAGESGGQARVIVQPNNPEGRFWDEDDTKGPGPQVVDESFCDIAPERSLISAARIPGRLVLKSFGKFWGLAGLRLGFAIGDPVLIDRLRNMLGPWPVSGPAIRIGTEALGDRAWADATRARLHCDAGRLDRLMGAAGNRPVGGTSLFRLYDTDAADLFDQLANAKILTRVFPYSDRWLRLGLPRIEADWSRLEAAL